MYHTEAVSPRRGERWLLAGLFILVALLSVKYGVKVAEGRSAIRRWQPQLLELDRVDIARAHNYPNPPIMAVLLEPFARMPPLAGALLWFYLKAVLALVALVWTFRLVEEPGWPFPLWAKVVTTLLALKPVVDDLNHGNVNLFILFLVVAALTAYRVRRDLLAGLILGLAIGCKITPALFVPYFLWKRQYRVLAGCALGVGLFLYPGVIPGLRLGFAENGQHLASWYEGMVKPYVADGRVSSEHANQSLPGLIARLLTPAPSCSEWEGDVNVPTHFHNVLALSPRQAWWLTRGAMGVYALAVVLGSRAPTGTRRGRRLAAEYGLILVGMLLFSERTWKHHAVTVMVPVAVLVCELAVRGWRWAAGGALGAAAGLMLLTGLGTGYEGRGRLPLSELAQVYGAYTLAFGLLGLGMLAVMAAPAAKLAGRSRGLLRQGEGQEPDLAVEAGHLTEPAHAA